MISRCLLYDTSFGRDSFFTFSTLLRSFLLLMPCSSIFWSILSVRAERSSMLGSSAEHSSFSSARTDSAAFSNASTLASSFALFFSILPFQTKVYLFATDSIFVPSMYWTFSDTTPSSFIIITVWRNNSSKRPSHRRSLRKRFIVRKSGRDIPESHM